ncbi:DUF3368 domain-containing protein [Pseudanabaenaceae cyanobacterium LEGE 13415]|nr:DUF3368 domain-containing protein [Pseudanabaenaceae cyanobacterium LEGE 13415]
MIIVSDTTPLSELAKVGQIHLLHELFDVVIIPQEVYVELITGNHPAAQLIPELGWLEIRSLLNVQECELLQRDFNLDIGEAAAIALAEELNADQVLIDERAARRVAISRQLPVIGTIGILILAKQRGLLGSVKEVLDALIGKGTRIGDRLYDQALTLAQEQEDQSGF